MISQVVSVYMDAWACMCIFLSLCFSLFWVHVCEREPGPLEESQGLMDGSTLSWAKWNLTAEFNDIYFQATHFQTCSGSVLSAETISVQFLKPGVSLLMMSLNGKCLQHFLISVCTDYMCAGTHCIRFVYVIAYTLTAVMDLLWQFEYTNYPQGELACSYLPSHED